MKRRTGTRGEGVRSRLQRAGALAALLGVGGSGSALLLGEPAVAAPLDVVLAADAVLAAPVPTDAVPTDAVPTDAAPPAVRTLDELLAAFRKSPGLSARFEEHKYIALLEAPLKSSGALYFLPEDKLARHVERPKRSVILLAGKRLRIADETGTRDLDLAKMPALAALVQSFSQVLRGDRAALDEHYRVEFRPATPPAPAKGEGRTGSWRLRLTPKNAPLSEMVSSIELTGSGPTIATLTVSEPNGDRSVTHFSDVDTERRFSEAERKRLFSLPR